MTNFINEEEKDGRRITYKCVPNRNLKPEVELILALGMSISSFFGSRIAAVPTPVVCKAAPWGFNGGGGELVIECSSRPKKKGTAHHMKTRPRKTQPWDIRRKPTVYAPLPPLPPDWTLVSSSSGEVGAVSETENVASPSPLLSSQAPPTAE